MPGPSDAQAPAPEPAPRDPQAALPLADRGRLAAVRGVQFALDLALSALLSLLPMSVVLVLPRNPDGTLGDLLVSIPVIGLALAAAVALSWWYWAVLPVRRGGRTLAMGWLGLAVTRPDGQRVGVALMTLRWLGLLVDAILYGAVGLAAILLTARAQRVGDLLAGTEVVRTSSGAARDPDPAPGDPAAPDPAPDPA